MMSVYVNDRYALLACQIQGPCQHHPIWFLAIDLLHSQALSQQAVPNYTAFLNSETVSPILV